MNYQESLDFLFNQLPMFSRIGAAAYKKDITNTIILCEAFGNPQNKFKSIHIAGTNGKGSTSHMLAAVLQTAGYKTGLYTSPHLKDFRERIKVNGQMCDEQFVIDFTERIQPLIKEIQPSFFEITVAMAFEYFVQQKVDVAVIEVGLGGRLDSTNIIMPELSVITNIGWDHMNLLGNSLESIAVEKAGIIKKNIPAVIGEYLPETKNIFSEKALQQEAPIVFAQEKRYVANWKNEHHLLTVEVADTHTDERMMYHLDLNGLYQTKNLLTVLEALHRLRLLGWNITDETIKLALSKVKKITGLHGRWELIQQQPDIVLDVAHNADGIRQITEQLEISDYHHIHIVIGMVKDKDAEHVLALLPDTATYYFTNAQIPRALAAEELMHKAKKTGLNGTNFPNVNMAIDNAKQHATKNDLILVCGSVFVVGEVNI